MANVKQDKALGSNQLAGGEMLENNAQTTQTPAVSTSKTVAKKPNGKKKNDGKPNGFVRFFKRIGLAFKNMKNELKNVTWPTFGKVMASTGVVLMVVGIFFVLLLGIDSGLAALFDLIIKK